MKTAELILAIDTSCDETAVSVTCGTNVLANIVWSQAQQHAEFGGVMPSLAKRMHAERITEVTQKALGRAGIDKREIDCVAVTTGPGLAIALEVGILAAKTISNELGIPLLAINHIEGHLLSNLAVPRNKPATSFEFPALGLVISGGHTELVHIRKFGQYQILAQTQDDALGEALDKAARMLGLGYPGGAVLEKMAKFGDPKAYSLPLPMARQRNFEAFSYSGLKTAFFRLTNEIGTKSSTRQQTYNLAATFQNRAFQHLEKVCSAQIERLGNEKPKYLWVGGGVAANALLRKRLRRMAEDFGLKTRFPYSKKLIGDNAAMIGVAAYLRRTAGIDDNIIQPDRRPRWTIGS